MLRDFKFLRRNPGKNANAEEVENVPPNSRDYSNPQMSTEPSRPPFNAIIEPPQPPRIPKSITEEINRPTRGDRTPSKPKPRYSDASMPLRTPEKQGPMSRNRFNWAQKGEIPSNNGTMELKEKDEGRVASNANTPTSTRAGGRATLSYSECNSVQSTPTKSVSKPPNSGFSMPSGSRTVCNVSGRMGNYAALSKGIPSSCNSSTVVNTVEVPYFELKEDPSFWMEHNVQVLIRIRPLNNMEKSSFGFSRCLKQESAQAITWVGQPETRFMFDHVACEGIDQETLFRMVGLPMVENCLSGYNSCMFAYGQEENNSLRCQNEDLSNKLHKTEAILSRVKEELAQFRIANGRSAYINFDEEQLLQKKLTETDEERLQLAQKLLGLCNSVLKAAGISIPTPEISISVAEEALEQLMNRVVALEMELNDVKLKIRISHERIRLSELMPQTSSTEGDENCPERKRASQTPFLSALDR